MILPINYTEATWQERRAVRNQYIQHQNGKCAHCGNNLDEQPKDKPKINWKLFPKGFLDHPVHLHHSHDTGMTIGAVHAYCNAILWQYHGE